MPEFSNDSSDFHFPAPNHTGSDFHNYISIKSHGYFILGTVVGYGRLWFVKSISPEYQNITQLQQMLLKEYEILVGLHHSSIVKVIAFTDIEGVGSSIVMEYVDGQHLDKYLVYAGRRQRQHLAYSLTEAVAYLHENGINHMDLKPENILVSGSLSSPKVTLIDFNLSDGSVFRYNKEQGGNRKYAAPEQFDKDYISSPTADVWSLGKLIDIIAPGISWHSAIKKAGNINPALRPADASMILEMVRRRQEFFRISAIFSGMVLLLGVLSVILLVREPKRETLTTSSPTLPSIEATKTNPTDSSSFSTDSQGENASYNRIDSEIPQFEKSTTETPDKFATHEKEHLNFIQTMRKNFAEGKRQLTKYAHDTIGVTLGGRVNKLMGQINEVNKIVYAPVMTFRNSCPEEVLARHSAEWGTSGDPEIVKDWHDYQLYATKLLEEAAQKDKEYREQQKRLYEEKKRKRNNLSNP